MRKNLTYTFIFFVTLGLVFSIHLQVFPQAQTFLIQSYTINAVLAIAALLLLGIGMRKKNNNLANLYLITVALKLIVYFLFFSSPIPIGWDRDTERVFHVFCSLCLGLTRRNYFVSKAIQLNQKGFVKDII